MLGVGAAGVPLLVSRERGGHRNAYTDSDRNVRGRDTDCHPKYDAEQYCVGLVLSGVARRHRITPSVGFPVSAKVVRWVKDRITHPRTGYVKYPERSGKRRGVGAAIALVMGVGIALAAVLLDNENFEGTLGYAATAAAGGALAAALAVRAHKMSMTRFYLSALTVAGGAAWSFAQGLSFIGALGVMWLALGCVSVITGTIALAAYLRKNTPQGEPLHE